MSVVFALCFNNWIKLVETTIQYKVCISNIKAKKIVRKLVVHREKYLTEVRRQNGLKWNKSFIRKHYSVLIRLFFYEKKTPYVLVQDTGMFYSWVSKVLFSRKKNFLCVYWLLVTYFIMMHNVIFMYCLVESSI